jgi:hypothetical protein
VLAMDVDSLPGPDTYLDLIEATSKAMDVVGEVAIALCENDKESVR